MAPPRSAEPPPDESGSASSGNPASRESAGRLRDRWRQRLAQLPASSSRGRRRFSRRELVAVGGGAAMTGGAVIAAVSLALRSESAPLPSPTMTPAPTVTPTPVTVAHQATPVPTIAPLPTPMPTPQRDAAGALVETSLSELHGFLSRREVSAEDLAGAAETRIARFDAVYGAVIETNPDAGVIARQLDAELAQGAAHGLLHGVPLLLKDVITTADAMHTTTGALALAGNDVAADATIVRRLREAGAVMLGKTNLTEWSNVRATGQTAGWSDRGGQTRNPYDPDMSPWGSSSGSAAAVALSYVPAALGVETNGSIICPAAACGVVGLKPTVGLVSRTGVMPVAMTLDSPGPLARNVADIAAVMNVIAGYDPDDPAHGPLGWTSPAATAGDARAHAYDAVDYTEALDSDGLRGARIGICWQLWGFDPEADAVARQVISRLREAGAEVVPDVVIPTLDELKNAPDIGTVVNTELTAGMAAFFARYMADAPVNSMQKVVDWNLAHTRVVMATCGQEGLVETLDALALDDPAYVDAVTSLTTRARQEGMDAAMDSYELDAIVAPTAPVPTAITTGGGTDFAGSSAQAAALAGYPSITVPVGQVRGLPVGLHLCGRAFSERTLIRLAYGIEQLLQARTPPDPVTSHM